jgi:hypothetical protein
MNVENYLNMPWAYTGSIAMRLHANRLGVPFPANRPIKNTNIAVESPAATARILRGTGAWNYVNGAPPRSNANHVPMVSSRNNKLNLFKLGGNYALGGTTYAKGKPVLTLNSLMNRKQNLAKNKLKPNNMAKTLLNIQILQRLLNASATRSPSRTPTPKKRYSPIRNSNKTPSPKKFKKLTF